MESFVYEESKSSVNLPPVGTRVRRGPDWCYGHQDSNGPGTIVGHKEIGCKVILHKCNRFPTPSFYIHST